MSHGSGSQLTTARGCLHIRALLGPHTVHDCQQCWVLSAPEGHPAVYSCTLSSICSLFSKYFPWCGPAAAGLHLFLCSCLQTARTLTDESHRHVQRSLNLAGRFTFRSRCTGLCTPPLSLDLSFSTNQIERRTQMCAYIVVSSNGRRIHRAVYASSTSEPTAMSKVPWGSRGIRANVFFHSWNEVY